MCKHRLETSKTCVRVEGIGSEFLKSLLQSRGEVKLFNRS